jgi:hypothetical protein
MNAPQRDLIISRHLDVNPGRFILDFCKITNLSCFKPLNLSCFKPLNLWQFAAIENCNKTKEVEIGRG